ncbi:MAG TPA: hypothetical protein VK528_10770 [Flavobacterium sp.]|nr:hypothetical protein [Flavobacterium sp.]
MIRKIWKYLKEVNIDILIYSMKEGDLIAPPDISFEIKTEALSYGKRRYFINDKGILVHQSFLFNCLNVLKLIGEKGPAIGDCLTVSQYKGRSIYPFVISYIATELLVGQKYPEVFIIVNSDNISSIRGIEKAGFKLHTAIKAKRFLLFYYNVHKKQAVDR